MKKIQIIILLIAVLTSFAILTGLYLLSPLGKEMYRASFDRKFMDAYFEDPYNVMDIEVNSFYIAGYSDDQLYLGNSTAPFNLLSTNLSLTDSSRIILKVKLDSMLNPQYFKLVVNPPNFYLANGVQPIILKGDTANWTAAPFIRDSSYYFTEAVPMGKQSFALKSLSKETKGYELALKTQNSFAFHNDLLEKQVDGLFCVDGKLMFNQKLNQMVYLYFYRNQFIVADTNLQLNYRGKTIDTFSRARINVAKIDNTGGSMLSDPPRAINGLSCTDREFLYVKSNLLAKNEDKELFLSGSTIDRYRLTDGLYMGSYHIPDYKNQKMTSFQVINDQLFAVFGRYLIARRITS